MGAGGISPLGTDEEGRAIATVVSAFAADPVERWLYPDEEEYGRHFPEFAAAFGTRAFERGTAWALDGGVAVALWLGPGIEPDGDAVAEVLTGSVLGQMAEAHIAEPHWYLPWLAVEPGGQGAGLGSRLLAYCLEVVDEAGLPAFLETPNPRTTGLYERHGFEVVAATLSPTCPPLTSMLRPAEGARSSL